MKSIDFTKPGGFPLTQNQLNYLQTAYREAVISLAKIGGNAGPFIISGIEVANPSPGTYTVTEGWLFYNGDMVHVADATLAGIAAGYSPYVQISNNTAGLTYNDGSSHEVVLDNYATLVTLPAGSPNDSAHFLLTGLQRFGVGLGLANREADWNELVVSTDASVGGVTGSIYYKKNFINNTLHIRGLLSANNAQNFAASPGALFYSMGTLPAGYLATNSVYFIAQYYVAGSVEDSAGISWIKQINCVINNTGQFLVNWIKPASSVVGYGITFNTIVPLD
jgi:hypothetical protein